MPSYSNSFPKELPTPLHDCLRGLGHFVYYPNPGNLGDELIAAATVQLFERLGLSFETYEEGRDYGSAYTLVYGGGGIMVPEWGYLGHLYELFSAPGLERCVVLSHSMHDCPELLQLMDERFTVFLRESKSFAYAKALNNKATFHLADDMVFYMEPRLLPPATELRHRYPCPSLIKRIFALLTGKDKNIDHVRLLSRFYGKTWKRIVKRLPDCLIPQENGKIVFFMRRDQEQQADFNGKHKSLDLSRLGGSSCRWHDFNLLGVTHYLETIDQADTIITDRLHISIAAAMLGKQVIMLDNSYGKLSGVYNQSMANLPNISFCRNPEDFRRELTRLGFN